MKRNKIMLIFLVFVVNALVLFAGTQNERYSAFAKHEPQENTKKDMPVDLIFFMSYLYQ